MFEGGTAPKQTDETKKKIGNTQRGKEKPPTTVEKMRKAQQSEEVKEKIRLKISGVKRPAYKRKKTDREVRPVQCIETKVIYDNCAEAARDTGACASQILRCCNGKGKSSNYLTWKFA